MLGSIPGAVSGGAIGNVLGRILGVIALPGKWLFGHIGRRIGQLLGLIPGAIEGLFILPGKYLGAAIGGFLGDLMQPMQNAVPALAGVCDCGCGMVDCTCSTDDCSCMEKESNAEDPNVGTAIAALRQQAVVVTPKYSSVPETGDAGVAACGMTALFSWLILLWLAGARKKEDS